MSFPAIEVENLSKSVVNQGKKIAILEEISFSVNHGDVFGVIGSSGAGKSTLLRCLASLIPFSSGRVRFRNKDGSDFYDRPSIGYVFQDFRLFFSKTVLGNVAYPLLIQGVQKKIAFERAEEILCKVGMERKKDSFPAFLSGGEKQRVAIARAVINKPALLMCDEVTSALDSLSKEDILKILSEMNRDSDLTIVFVSHEIGVVKKLCNRLMVLEKGKKIEENSTEELFLFPQSSLTKSLLGFFQNEGLDRYLDLCSHKENTEVLRLGFRKREVFRPIIGELLKNTLISVNILAGDIDSLCDSSVGFLVVAITGSVQERGQFKQSLTASGVVICNSI